MDMGRRNRLTAALAAMLASYGGTDVIWKATRTGAQPIERMREDGP